MKTKLFGTPRSHPQFSTKISTPDGEELLLSDPRALRALISLMDMYAVLGGAASHYGGPASLAEINSSLHALIFSIAKKSGKEWHELFHLVNDAGHCENGLYALRANYSWGLSLGDLKGFRSFQSPLTGHGEVHCFPGGVLLSNGPLGSALPQSQGLALGEALSGKMRTTITVVSDGASMEGEAKEAFAAIPGLALKGKLGPFVMIINDNQTKLSGRIEEESFSMEPTFRSLQTLGWDVVELKKGNDLAACVAALDHGLKAAIANPSKPIVIHARTIKGIGTKKTTESSSGGHGFPLKSPRDLPTFLSEIYGGKEYPSLFTEWITELEKIASQANTSETGEKIQVGISKALIKARKEGLPLVSVTSDLPGSTGVGGFRKEFPEASFDVGIAESNMISTAAGLSKCGFIPVVDTFAQFGVTKGALPLTMASLSEAPLIAIFSHTGFQDAADGASHQALTYLAMVSAIPHVCVYSLSCSEEAEALVFQAIQEFSKERLAGRTPPTSVFFLGRENFPRSYVTEESLKQSPYMLGKIQVLKDTCSLFKKRICLISSGSLIPQVLLAATSLEHKGLGSVVLNVSAPNRLDRETLIAALNKSEGRLIVVEDHQTIGGLGQMIAHLVAQEPTRNGWRFEMKSHGVKGAFGRSSYQAIELYREHQLDADSLVAAVLSFEFD